MARLTRLAVAGHLHHVALRGHSGAPVFRDDIDRESFLDCLNRAVRQHGVAVHAYVLLDSEVQFLATPSSADGLSRAVQSLGRRYVTAFNRRHARTGTLWDGRFRSSVLDPASWLMPAMVYIETLSVQQQSTPDPVEFARSSVAAHLGRRRDALLSDHPAYWSVGNTPFEREQAHADILVRGVLPEQRRALETALARGLALGDPRFLETLQKYTNRPVRPRSRGRPRKK